MHTTHLMLCADVPIRAGRPDALIVEFVMWARAELWMCTDTRGARPCLEPEHAQDTTWEIAFPKGGIWSDVNDG